MARPAPDLRGSEEAPVLDPSAVERAYRVHRARRHARLERRRARRNAHVRFFVAVVFLLGLTGYLALTVWRQIERLFGL